jgi:hypothetical protein
MGYVTDSETLPNKKFHPGTTLDGVWFPSFGAGYLLQSHNRSQYGYRSGSLSFNEWQAINNLDSQLLNSFDMPEIMRTLEVIGEDVNPIPINKRIAFVVNDRNFTSTKRYPQEFTYSGEYRTGPSASWHSFDSRGAFEVTGFRSGFLPSRPSDSTLKGMAGQMIRAIRPTAPDFRLARFLGELRDAHKMFSPNSYFLRGNSPVTNKVRTPQPVSVSVPSFYKRTGHNLAGGAYLNYQFAVKPTWNDIQRAAQAVKDSEQIVKQFVRDAAHDVHRSSTRQLSQETVLSGIREWTTTPPFNITNVSAGQVLVSGCPGAVNTAMPKPTYHSYAHYRDELRVFSTFAYYIGDPDGFLGRLGSYVRNAEKVLGIQGDLKTLYDLTPFSWLLDWHVDIGGLLAYQQDVADYSLVSRRSGFVYEVNGWGQVALDPLVATSSNQRHIHSSGAQSNIRVRNSYRKSGSPYDMDLNGWSNYGPFQWSILAAMGMSILHIPHKKTG